MASRVPAGWRWPCMALASSRSARWTPRFQYVAALAPILSLAALALWWADTRGTGRIGTARTSPGGRSCSAASLPRPPSPCCGTRPGRASGRRWPLPRRSRTSCSLVRAARHRRRHAVGPDQCRARRALPGRRRAAGALARHACPAPPRPWATARRASPSSSPSPSRSSSTANGSRWPMPSSSPPWPRSRAVSASTPCAGCAGRCSPSWSCASCSIPRC